MTAQPISASATDAQHFAAWIADTAATLRARLWWIIAVAATGLLAGVIYLRTADYTYSATLRVVPAPGSNRESGNLGALSTLATLTGATLESMPVTPFRLYVEGVYTRQIAAGLAQDPALMRHIFADEWDAQSGKWREPMSLGRSLTRTLNRLGGQADRLWTPPDAARLQGWIITNLKVDQTLKTPIVTLSLADTDPLFAKAFLTSLHDRTDAWVRNRNLDRTRANIAYLNQRLPGITQADHREAIFATLSDQQQRAMTANNPAPFAAEPFGAATVSPQPTSPRQLPVLILAVFFGAIMGVVLAVFVPRRA
jgi:hypothetical protein